MAGPSSTNYNFNSMQEIKSHSSVLFNERMAILFYLLDMKSMQLNKNYSVSDVLEVRATLRQIYMNIRMLIRFNPTVRASLNLDTKVPGVYTIDVMFDELNKMIEFCENTNYTTRYLYILAEVLNSLQVAIRDVLQYFHYFIRPDFRQKPDVERATENYKQLADRKTIEQLKEIIGKNHHIDFNTYGTNKVSLLESNAEHYDETVDGPIQDDEDIDITEYDPVVDGEMEDEINK